MADQEKSRTISANNFPAPFFSHDNTTSNDRSISERPNVQTQRAENNIYLSERGQFNETLYAQQFVKVAQTMLIEEEHTPVNFQKSPSNIDVIINSVLQSPTSLQRNGQVGILNSSMDNQIMQAKLNPVINNSDLSTLVKEKTFSPTALIGQMQTLALNVKLNHIGTKMVEEVYQLN